MTNNYKVVLRYETPKEREEIGREQELTRHFDLLIDFSGSALLAQDIDKLDAPFDEQKKKGELNGGVVVMKDHYGLRRSMYPVPRLDFETAPRELRQQTTERKRTSMVYERWLH